MVLLKKYGPEGFTFYTNYTSRKASELNSNPRYSIYGNIYRTICSVSGPELQMSDSVSTVYQSTDSNPKVA
jgi:pyridoxamine 5'-phosphate oxidase